MSRENFKLLCFQTSLPLTALLLHRLITACHFRVATLSGHAALAFSPRGIAPKLNRSHLSEIYCCGQSSENINWSGRRCLPLGLLSAARGACAVVQKSPSKRRCGERQASLKAALEWCMPSCCSMSWENLHFKIISCSWHMTLLVIWKQLCISALSLNGGIEVEWKCYSLALSIEKTLAF